MYDAVAVGHADFAVVADARDDELPVDKFAQIIDRMAVQHPVGEFQ